jgi:hypothetical protein
MRAALDDLLCRRYPELYANRNADMRSTCMCWGFDHGDGWFAIIDALSEVLTTNAKADGRPVQPVTQVKEKFGTLRFYHGATEADDGAVDMAEEISERICEQTGKPGRLTCKSRWYATRVPGADPKADVVGIGPGKDGRMGMPPLGFSLAEMVGWRADVLHGPVEVLDGRLDLVDAMLRHLANGNRVVTENAGTRNGYADSPPVRVTAIWESPQGLRVAYTGGGRRAEGVIAFALTLSLRLNPFTGAAGPVDDDGIIIPGDSK